MAAQARAARSASRSRFKRIDLVLSRSMGDWNNVLTCFLRHRHVHSDLAAGDNVFGGIILIARVIVPAMRRVGGDKYRCRWPTSRAWLPLADIRDLAYLDARGI